MSPENERNLKEELWGCFKHIGIPFDELYRMPVRDRKFFIMKHNQEMEKRENMMNHNGKSRTIDNELINQYAKIEQLNSENLKSK